MKNYKIINTLEDLDELVAHIDASEIIAYDTETTGLNVRKDTVIGFSVSGAIGFGYYLPLLKWDGKELARLWSHEMAVKVLTMLLDKKLVMHNASFDCRITHSNFDIDFKQALYCDTIVLKHTVDEEYPFGLKDIAKKIQDKIGLDVSKTANQEQLDLIESIKANGGSVTKESYELYKADMGKIGIYAAADADLTLRVFEYYNTQVMQEGLGKFFYEDEVMPLLKEVTIPMEETGIPVDVNGLEDALKDISIDILEVEAEIQDLIAPHLGVFTDWYLNKELPPRRTGEFAQYLCKLKEVNLPKTKSGKFSMGAKALEKLKGDPTVDFLAGGPYLDKEDVLEVQKLWWAENGEGFMFNISSKHHLAKLFFETLKETAITKTEKGAPQMNEFFLSSVENKYDFARLIIVYNKLNKLKSAYLERFLHGQEDGIFYPRYNQHRTVSGRYGSDFQQMPRPMEHEPTGRWDKMVFKYTNMIRGFFISGDGYKFIDSDYESLEPHVFAHVSGDDGLKNIFLKGHDFYSTIAIGAENLTGVSADKKADNYLGLVNKGVRQNAKAYSLGVPYGMESYALSKNLNIGQHDAQTIIDQYLNSFPNLKAWMERSNNACKFKGFVKSEAGRVRHLASAPKIWFAHKDYILDSLKIWSRYHEDKKKYESIKFLRKKMVNYLNNAKNFQIQSLSASIVNRACIAINREFKRMGLDAIIVGQIHDQIVVRCSEKDLARGLKAVQYLMENTYKISIPLKAPPAVGTNLRDSH